MTLILVPLAALILTACGGGGSSDSPADDPVVSASAVSNAGPIGDLFGRVTIAFVSNTGSGEAFRIVGQFGPDSVTAAGTAIDTRAVGTATLGGETMRETLPLGCTYVAGTAQHLCLAPSGDLTLASLFDRPIGGRADGVFTPCTTGGSTEVCARQLILSPAGPATLSVDRVSAKLAATGDDVIGPYLGYIAQGAVAPSVTADASPDSIAAISAALDTLAE